MDRKRLGQKRVRIIKKIRIGKKRKLELVQVEFDEVVGLPSAKPPRECFHKARQVIALCQKPLYVKVNGGGKMLPIWQARNLL